LSVQTSNLKPINAPKYISRIYAEVIAKAVAEMGRIGKSGIQRGNSHIINGV
jgi:hypothetical protein